MIDEITKSILSILAEKNAITKDFDVYEYGIKIFLSESSNIITILIIAYLFGNLWLGLEYIIVFGVFRIVMGGYHAPTVFKCYLSTNFLFLVNEWIISNNQISNSPFFIILFLLAISIIWKISPMDTDKNKFDEIIKKKHSNISKFLCCLIFILFLSNFELNIIYLDVLQMITIYLGGLLILQYLINCKKEGENYE